MLCLTVYEAKGLEFDDVILWNFFNQDGEACNWKLLNDLTFTEEAQEMEAIVENLDFF